MKDDERRHSENQQSQKRALWVTIVFGALQIVVALGVGSIAPAPEVASETDPPPIDQPRDVSEAPAPEPIEAKAQNPDHLEPRQQDTKPDDDSIIIVVRNPPPGFRMDLPDGIRMRTE